MKFKNKFVTFLSANRLHFNCTVNIIFILQDNIFVNDICQQMENWQTCIDLAI